MLKSSSKYIATFVIFTLLATAFSSGISFIYSTAQFRVNTQERLSESATAYGHELNGIIYGIETAVNTVQSYLEVLIDPMKIEDPDYYEALEPTLEKLALKFRANKFHATSFYIRFDPNLSSGTAGVFHADTNQDLLLESLIPTDISLYEPTDTERVGWFYIPMSFKSGNWMSPYYNANIDTYMVSYVAPIFVKGKAIGIVGMDMDFDTLQAIADSHQGAGKVVLVDKSYAFMVHDTFSYKDRLDTVDGGQLDYLIELMKTKASGTVHYKLKEVPKVLGFSRLKNDWTVMVHLTENEAFNSFNKTASTLLFINIAVTLAITAFALLFSRYTQRLVLVNTTLESVVLERTQQLTETNEYLEETVAELENQQAELLLVNNQLEEALQVQHDMQDRLIETEKLAALGELVAGVAHELNTPIGNAITLNSYLDQQIEVVQNLLSDTTAKNPNLSDAISSLSESCQLSSRTLERVSSLVEHFKLLAQPQHIADVQRLHLHAFLFDILSLYNEKLDHHGHHFTIQGDPSLSFITSPQILGQVLHQLIVNSLLHGFDTLKGREIRVTFSLFEGGPLLDKGHKDEPHRQLILIFSDNGLGIAKAHLSKVFNPFFTTRKNKGSVGLGLHMVHNYVTQTLNGSIAIQSEKNHGTQISIQIPEFK